MPDPKKPSGIQAEIVSAVIFCQNLLFAFLLVSPGELIF